MVNLTKLHNDITEVVAAQLHYFENVEKINELRTAAEVRDAIEGGTQRYMDDPLYKAKVDSLVAHIMDRVLSYRAPARTAKVS